MGKRCFEQINSKKFTTKLPVKSYSFSLSPYHSHFLPPLPLSLALSPSGPPAASPLTNEEKALKRPDTTESLNSSMSNGTTDAGKKGKHTQMRHSPFSSNTFCASLCIKH